MKKFLFIVFLCGFCCCTRGLSKRLPDGFDMSVFDSMSKIEQAKFINSLDKNSKIKLLSMLLPNRTFGRPPNGYVKFFEDGSFVYYYENEDAVDNAETFLDGRWRYKDNTIVINNNVKSDEFGVTEIWDDMWIEKENIDYSILSIHVKSGVDINGMPLTYTTTSLHGWVIGDIDDTVSRKIDAYSKKKSNVKK